MGPVLVGGEGEGGAKGACEAAGGAGDEGRHCSGLVYEKEELKCCCSNVV